MVFNIIARNQDDHTRNIAFSMDTNGLWSLTPAFDVVWAYNPSGIWTNGHQLTINGKRDDFTREDIIKIASQFGIKDANAIIDSIIESTLKS